MTHHVLRDDGGEQDWHCCDRCSSWPVVGPGWPLAHAGAAESSKHSVATAQLRHTPTLSTWDDRHVDSDDSPGERVCILPREWRSGRNSQRRHRGRRPQTTTQLLCCDTGNGISSWFVKREKQASERTADSTGHSTTRSHSSHYPPASTFDPAPRPSLYHSSYTSPLCCCLCLTRLVCFGTVGCHTATVRTSNDSPQLINTRFSQPPTHPHSTHY